MLNTYYRTAQMTLLIDQEQTLNPIFLKKKIKDKNLKTNQFKIKTACKKAF
jgi:hypothetical protein